MQNNHKRKLKYKWFVFSKKTDIFFFPILSCNFYLCIQRDPQRQGGKSFINFDTEIFSCEDLFAKHIFQDSIYNLRTGLLPIKLFFQHSNCPQIQNKNAK